MYFGAEEDDIRQAVKWIRQFVAQIGMKEQEKQANQARFWIVISFNIHENYKKIYIDRKKVGKNSKKLFTRPQFML